MSLQTKVHALKEGKKGGRRERRRLCTDDWPPSNIEREKKKGITYVALKSNFPIIILIIDS